MGQVGVILVVSVLIMSCACLVKSDASDHRYKAGDLVPLYVNKVGPYHNPTETYRYYDLPFCHPDNVTEKNEALHEVLNGDRFISAPYNLEFLVNKDSEVVCKKKLTKEDVYKFRNAVAKDYYIQMYYDDMPFLAFIGRTDIETNKYFLFKHIHFEINYNKECVIGISAHMDPSDAMELTEEMEAQVKFKYTVKWKETNIPFGKRMEKYFGYYSLPYVWEVRWFSITNSCVTILLLTGCLLTYYMRVLKKDFENSYDEELAENQEETGWKYIHGDVFRYPKNKSLFAAAIGSGIQLLTLSILILILGTIGAFCPYKQGYLLTALVVIYPVTSGIAGYTATYLHGQIEGTEWVTNLLLTGLLFCGPSFATFCFLNIVAMVYKATTALPLGTIVVIILIWTLVALPLLVLGGIAGKNCKYEFQAPCRTTKCPRAIPPLRWYRHSLHQMALAGFVPFGVIYNELYYIFSSLWGHRIYTIYGILFLVCTILLITTALVTVAMTCFQLAAEDYRWWWRSFVCGGSVGLYFYGYCLYYYSQSYLSGFLQSAFFFGYMACISYGIFLALGTVGFFASLLYVRHIYGSIKCD